MSHMDAKPQFRWAIRDSIVTICLNSDQVDLRYNLNEVIQNAQ